MEYLKNGWRSTYIPPCNATIEAIADIRPASTRRIAAQSTAMQILVRERQVQRQFVRIGAISVNLREALFSAPEEARRFFLCKRFANPETVKEMVRKLKVLEARIVHNR